MIEHDGEFVLTSKGSKDFGEISENTAMEASASGQAVQPGKIRLRIGRQTNNKGDYGELHIERSVRLSQLRANGYDCARDLVEDIAENYDSIYPGKFAPLMLVKHGGKKDTVICVELMIDRTSAFYDVKTGFITRRNYTKNKTPLWENPQSGI
jgi:hypothetical protein